MCLHISHSKMFFLVSATLWPCSVVSNVLDCDVIVSEFELQKNYYIHFWINTLRKGMNLLIPPAMGYIVLLLSFLHPITKTIQVRRTRYAGYCWRSRDKFISDVLRWTPTYGRAKAGRLARTYIQQLCEDMGCRPEDLPEAMNVREKWQERVRDIRAGGTTSWWWWLSYYKDAFGIK